MAHFAQLDDNNLVTNVIVVHNNELLVDGIESEAKGIEFCQALFGADTKWAQTSYNSTMRKKYAGVGDFYDSVNNVFITPQNFASWILDENFDWQAPTPKPVEGLWLWNEESLSWIEIGV
jgi:hypothetical protein